MLVVTLFVVSLQNGQPLENGVTNALSTLMHPAQIHLPISQVRFLFLWIANKM